MCSLFPLTSLYGPRCAVSFPGPISNKLIFSKFADGYCWRESCNHENHKGCSSHYIVYWYAENSTKQLAEWAGLHDCPSNWKGECPLPATCLHPTSQVGNTIWERSNPCWVSVTLLCTYHLSCVAVSNPKGHSCHSNSRISPEQHNQGHMVQQDDWTTNYRGLNWL